MGTFIMKIVLVLSCVIAITVAHTLVKDFKSFKQQFDKRYKTSLEEAIRLKTYEKNVDYINKHNLEAANGLHTFYLGLNEYADLSTEEWELFLLGTDVYEFGVYETENEIIDENLPTSVDWREKGYVTNVKNQGHCGSCWAFSATGSMEGAWFKKSNSLVSLSEQNLVDCDKESLGCKGGSMELAFKYVMKTGGIDTEESYPYKGVNGHCNYTKDNVGASITSFKNVKSNNEKALQKAVAEVGPVSIGIDASKPSFHLYKEGIYYEKACSSTHLDHGVLVVGYGEDKDRNKENGEYWIVKNSWGTTWGMKGYIHMSRNKNNNCGIASDASYPIA